MVSGQLHAPAALPRGKSLRYPFIGGWLGTRSRSGRGGEQKTSRSLPEWATGRAHAVSLTGNYV